MADILLKEMTDGILTLTLNRPESMNCFSVALLNELNAAIKEANFDSELRVIIITGAKGEKKAAFCTGADLVERRTMSPDDVKRFIHTISSTFADVENVKVPAIAAINGFAFGGGLELALACDIRVASSNAVVGLTETSLAIIPGAGGTQRLPRVVGIAKAKEMIYTAKRITADEALACGLVSQVVEPDQLMDTCMEISKKIAANGPVAVQQAKFSINKGMECSIDVGLGIESRAYAVTIPTEDRLEGLNAFKEKRKPEYKGK
ncbi:MAG: enoyl-CoA hydratase-related protein [Thermodesulfobacteriota bacterium]|nr:enoyl-CoA hydratase-related protein [Thermodesulfobacteriota bacterium]